MNAVTPIRFRAPAHFSLFEHNTSESIEALYDTPFMPELEKNIREEIIRQSREVFPDGLMPLLKTGLKSVDKLLEGKIVEVTPSIAVDGGNTYYELIVHPTEELGDKAMDALATAVEHFYSKSWGPEAEFFAIPLTGAGEHYDNEHHRILGLMSEFEARDMEATSLESVDARAIQP